MLTTNRSVALEVAVRRPQRWDMPFGESMNDEEVDRLLAIKPFCTIDATRFPPSLSLRGILRNDTRLLHLAPGDIVVREGDYGNSAFLVLSGQARVVLAGLSPQALGRPEAAKQSWWESLLRSWRRRAPEERDYSLNDRHGSSSPGLSLHGRETAQRGQLDHPRIFLQDVPRVLEATDTAALGPGELFGELAALTRSPRTATVFAETSAVLLEIRWQGLRDLMQRTDALQRHVEGLYRQHSLLVHLRETPLLATLPQEQLAAVADATNFVSYGEFDWQESYESAVKRRPGDAIVDEPIIAEEETPADGLILIRSGFARQSRRFGHGHQTIAYLGRGRAFGLAEAVEAIESGKQTSWRDSLRALGYVDVLHIPQQALKSFVFPHLSASTVAAIRPQTQETSSQVNESATKPVDQSLLEFLVERRLINGRQAMAIDLERCTRCDDCVRACAATHDNNPRFVRQGPRHGPLLVAQACMHCVDPICMIGCPTGAIARDETTGAVLINDRTCIGCSTCANGCPYDNIQMVEIRNRRGALLIDEATAQPIVKATKCDLCSGLSAGPACQLACPHDALVRLDLGNLGELAAWTAR